jgi:hypothetical protein
MIPLEQFRKIVAEHRAKTELTPATERKALIEGGILSKSDKLSTHYR